VKKLSSRSFKIALRWAAALALLALSATTATAQDLSAKSIEVPRSRHWIDNPPNWGYDPLAKQLLLGIETQGLFASQDGGESWRRIDDGSYHAATSIYPAKDRLVVDPASGDLFSLPRSQGFSPLLYRSGDGGRRWEGLLNSDRVGLGTGTEPVPGEVVSPEAYRLLFIPGQPGAMYLHTSFPAVHGEGEAVKGDRLWFSTDGVQGFKRLLPSPYSPSALFVTDKRLCMSVMLEGRGLYKLSCRDHGGGEWRDVAIAPAKDLAPIVSVWSGKDGAFLVLAGDALYVSTDDLKSFQRFAMPAGNKRLFLHPLHVYPAFLSAQEAEDRYIVYRLDKDHSLKKLGALAAPLLQVDFSRNLGIASKPGDMRPVFRAALQ
jgi:hypothetical protein